MSVFTEGGINNILSDTTELKRVFRWVFTFPEITGTDTSSLQNYHAKTSNRPKGSFEEVVIDSLGGKKWIGGKFAWETIDMTLYDPLSPSASKALFDWFRLNYNPEDGSMGYENKPEDPNVSYKKQCTLTMVTPDGTTGEEWTLKGCWPMSFDLGALDYAGNDAVEISFTMRYDNAVLSQSTPESTTEG
jgi:hypothetical protein